MKISVAIATLNEEKNIGACLDSVKVLANEVVIADEGSTDKTVEIAKKYKAKIVPTKHEPIFHISKQKAIDACKGDWILQLDADERVTPELKEEIQEVIQDTKYDGFWLPRKNYFLGRYLTKGGQYPDYTLRFYRRGKGYLPCKSVHEQAVVKGKVGYFKNPLLHYPYPSFSEYLKKSDRYTTLTAKELINKGKKPSIFGYLRAEFLAIKTFLDLFIRHKGFLDGFPGFVFALYSGLHHITAYIKFWELYYCKNKKI